jgi:predicted RNA-binding protein with PUA-like domain
LRIRDDRKDVKMNFWIFKSNPDYYNLRKALEKCDELNWKVSQKSKIHPVKIGDIGYFWQGKRNHGLYAIGEVKTEPKDMGKTECEKQQGIIKKPDRRKEFPRVCVRITKILEKYIPESQLKEYNESLSSMIINLKKYGSCFPIGHEQANILNKFILLKGTKYSPIEDLSYVIPKKIGIYAWFWAKDDKLVYVGKATGKDGLYQRIIRQHLNPDYLLTDKNKWNEKDVFQAQNPAILKGKPAIDKSAFRKNISRGHKLQPGIDSVEYIKNNFTLRFLNISRKEDIFSLEKELISFYKPKYNITNNPQINDELV